MVIFPLSIEHIVKKTLILGTALPALMFLFAMSGRDDASAQPSSHLAAAVPTSPGQAAFGAISEIVRMLEADSSTNWAKVDIEALRQHLIDMDAVVMRADVSQKPVPGGIEAVVTGAGATIASVQRMATNHARMLGTLPEYQTNVTALSNGVRISIRAKNTADTRAVARIRGLGFAGLLTEGSHHQPHHLAIARGEMIHQH